MSSSLTKLAEKCGVKDFVVENVHSLTKEPNPWSRSFKVCVPGRLEEHMKNPQMYPASLESRAFTQWPSRKQQNLTGPRLQEAPRPPGPQVYTTKPISLITFFKRFQRPFTETS